MDFVWVAVVKSPVIHRLLSLLWKPPFVSYLVRSLICGIWIKICGVGSSQIRGVADNQSVVKRRIYTEREHETAAIKSGTDRDNPREERRGYRDRRLNTWQLIRFATWIKFHQATALPDLSDVYRSWLTPLPWSNGSSYP